ncbi:hypothetical protein BDW69DRAFT_189779 [Aspergillus filifer]
MRLTGVPAILTVNSAQPTLATSSLFSPLRFMEKGTFPISIFEDLHFGECRRPSFVGMGAWGPRQSRKSITVLSTVLDAELPGPVVLNGGLITGENAFLEDATMYVNQITWPLVDRGLTWVSTYGDQTMRLTSPPKICSKGTKLAGCPNRPDG